MWLCHRVDLDNMTNAQYFGRKNMYKLEKDGVKYTLLPINSKASSNERTFLNVAREFKAKAKESKQVQSLVVK